MKDHIPVSYAELELKAKEALDEDQFRYVHGSAGTGESARGNAESFQAWRIVPRVLINCPPPDLKTALLGMNIPLPIFLAPIGQQKYIHVEGELATSRAASELGVPLILSSYSSVGIEQVANVNGSGPRLLQLYPCLDEEIMASFVRRAEGAGYSAIVITVEKPGSYWHYDGPRTFEFNQYGTGLYFSDPVFRSKLKKTPEKDREEALRLWRSIRSSPSYSWADIDKLRSSTRLPILLKGVLHPDDAKLALEHSIDGIILSNHGGRRIDSSVGALDMLETMREAVGNKIPILVDGGIRSGVDILKALALGADSVLVGRAYAYGLAIAGEKGVIEVVQNLAKELSDAVAVCGVSNIRDLDSNILRRTM